MISSVHDVVRPSRMSSGVEVGTRQGEMEEQGEKFWNLAQEMLDEIPKVRERHVQNMKTIAEMDVEMEMTKMKAEEMATSLVAKNKEIEATRSKIEEFSQQLAEKNKQIDDIGRKAQSLTELLWAKNKELEGIRRKAEADIMQLEEAHKLETDTVRFQAQQTEAEYHRATFERLRRTLQEKEARNTQLEKELLETRLMAGGNSMAPSLPKDLSPIPIEIQKLQFQDNPASEQESSVTSHRRSSCENASPQGGQNKSGDDREGGRDLSIEFIESSPLPDRVESYEIMKGREIEVEGAEANAQNGNRDSRQALKQTAPKPVVPLRRKQRVIR